MILWRQVEEHESRRRRISKGIVEMTVKNVTCPMCVVPGWFHHIWSSVLSRHTYVPR